MMRQKLCNKIIIQNLKRYDDYSQLILILVYVTIFTDILVKGCISQNTHQPQRQLILLV